MRAVLLLVFFTFSSVRCTPLPESRRLCHYKNVKVMNFKTESMTLNFSSTPEFLKTVLKNECESWKQYESRLKVRRSLASLCYKIIEGVAMNVLAKEVEYAAVKGRKVVVQGLKQDLQREIVTIAKTISKRSVNTLDENNEKLPNLNQLEEAIVKELEPLSTLLTYSSEKTQKKFQKHFGSVVAHFLRNGNSDSLSSLISEKYDIIMENINQHKTFDYRRINHDSINCDSENSSISFDLGVYSVDEGDENDLIIEMCEDLGIAHEETNSYYYHKFPKATFSNGSGTYQVDLESCAGNKILVCSSDAIQPSDCSVDHTEQCVTRIEAQIEEIYRKLRVGSVVLGSFEHIITWKNDLATVYKVAPHKLHYISPGASQRIEFGNHQLTNKESNRSYDFIIEVR